MALPAVLAVVWFAFVRLDWLMLAVVAFTPLSITLQDRGFNVGLSLPTEPLLFGITLLLFFRLLMTGRVDRDVARHPVSLAIYFYLGWMLLTSLTSSMPAVSIKHWIARVWFVVPYYFLMVHVFKTKSYRELLAVPAALGGRRRVYLERPCAVRIQQTDVHLGHVSIL